jgi:hypothetical protein
MKVYFGFTVAGDRSSLQAARRIVEWLDKRGHEVLTRHLVDEDAREQDRLLGPQQVFERDMRWLDAADVFIAEVSGSSFGLGFETGYVLGSSGRRAILFYRVDSAERISLLITGNRHPNCTVVSYQSIDELETILGSLLDERLIHDTRSRPAEHDGDRLAE